MAAESVMKISSSAICNLNRRPLLPVSHSTRRRRSTSSAEVRALSSSFFASVAIASASTNISTLRQNQKRGSFSVFALAAEPKNWRKLVSTSLAAAVISFTTANMSAVADLNKFEAETRGEFGIGSAAQFGSADLKKAVHVNENFRRANFTAADMRESDFSGSTFNGAYLEKAVAFKANFTGADLSDTLMDRMVLNEANLTNAVLVRSVLTRSDLGGAIIEGADFSDAVLDLPQKQALCKYANGTNPITGVSTRKSLGCGNSRRNAYGSPSSPLLSAPPPKLLDRDGFCDSATGLCEAN